MKSFYFSSFPHSEIFPFMYFHLRKKDLCSWFHTVLSTSRCLIVTSFSLLINSSLYLEIFLFLLCLEMGWEEDISLVKIVIPASYFSSFSFHFPSPFFYLSLPSSLSLSLCKQTREHSAPTSAILITWPLLDFMNFDFSPYSTETAVWGGPKWFLNYLTQVSFSWSLTFVWHFTLRPVSYF